VSELRKPRASRKTPAGGVPAAQPNVLQAIVGAKPSEAMPAPRPAPQRPDTPPTEIKDEDSGATTIPQQPSPIPPRAQQPAHMQPTQTQPPPVQFTGYAADASGLPMTPPQGVPQPGQPGAPLGYGQPQGFPQPYPPQQGWYPQQGYPGQQPMTPGGMHQLQPFGAPPPQPMTLTGQMRLFEADEIPDKYKVSAGPPKWIKPLVLGVLATSLAASVTFIIIRSTRDTAPQDGIIQVESVPPGAEVSFDGTRLADPTPMPIEHVPAGTRHEITIVLPRHAPYTETVDIPKQGGKVAVKAMLSPIAGKLTIVTQPDGAEIRIDGQVKGFAPKTIEGLDMDSAKQLELRLEGYEPYVQPLRWPDNGVIKIDATLQR
jgi:hypothetical protein